MESIFEDLTVVEFAGVLAGPAVGNFFSELGAEVIKVENKRNGGDVTRQWRQPGEQSEGPSAYFSSVNWNKNSLLLDLGDVDDKRQADALIEKADIVITNFKKGDDKKFDLTFEDLKAINSSVIQGHISGFGTESDRLAYDLILQAETGFMSMNGQPDSPPTKLPLALIDVLAAHQLKEGILCALLKQKEHPEQPFRVDVSLYDSAISSLINQATNWLMNRKVPERIGSLHPNIAPYGEIFTTGDNRLITLAIGSDRQFKDLCIILGVPELAGKPEYQHNETRVENRKELSQKLKEQIGAFQANSFLEECHNHFVPAAEVKNLQQVFESPKAQKLLLREHKEGRQTIRPKTTVFTIQS
ncbi:carnitine dehydratase [Aliifodinibius salipaludis]|uniref:Carnitine dehydratase n=1 Tax=Fodinibius salipaludis TaxID=2032627 RepID=A0A2A2GD55_9BACT|nr:CoA transferase [Aliifodinibius salipaludis]PAU95110.1 carnitine dehydratase [Aliifodinibius salipaludis]